MEKALTMPCATTLRQAPAWTVHTVDSANRGQCSVAGGFCGRHSAGAHVLCSWRERAGHGSARSWDLWPAESGAASSAEPGTMAEVAVSG